MKRLGIRIALVVVVLLVIGAVSYSSSAGVFFTMKFGSGSTSYNTVTSDELESGMPMDGRVYYIVDCLASGYTEYTDSGKTVTDSYYYLIPFEDGELICLITDADSQLEDQMDILYYDDEELMEKGVEISGVVRETETDLYPLFEEWCDECDITGYTLLPYTIDCTVSIEEHCQRFTIALIIWAVIAAAIVVGIMMFVKARRGRAAQQSMATSYAPASDMNMYNSGAAVPDPNNYNNGGYIPGSSADTYSSQTANGTHAQYQSQQQFQSQQPYQSQTDYGQNNNQQ